MNKDPVIFQEEDPIIILKSRYVLCMANNSKDTKHKIHIARRVNLLRNGYNRKMHKIYRCEGGLQLADIATKNDC